MKFPKLMALVLASVFGVIASDHVLAQRMSDREGQRYLARNGPKILPPRITIDHSDVASVQVEDTHVSLSPDALMQKSGLKFIAKTTINVITRRPLSEMELDTLAAQVRRQASFFHVVGVRFKLVGSGGGHYGWLLFWDGRDTVRTILGAKEQLDKAAASARASLRPAERLIGAWADANEFPGTYLLIERAGRLWLASTFSDGSGGDERIRLRITKGGLLVGVYSVSDLGTFKADGTDTARVSARLVDDKLHVSDNSEGRNPWFIGTPSSSINLSILPTSEPRSVPGGLAKKNFGSLDEVLACVRRLQGGEPALNTQQWEALRVCFSRDDIRKLGTLAQIGASAQISCGRDSKHSYRITRKANEVIWAALIADEEAHIAARYKHDSPRVRRGTAEAATLCADLLQRFGRIGTEVSGLIEEP